MTYRYFSLLLGLVLTNVHGLSFELNPNGDSVVGDVYPYWTLQGQDLFDVAYLRDLGYEELTAANRAVDSLSPGEDTRLVIPQIFILPDAPREGLVINIAEPRLYYYPKGSSQVITYPLGIGREGWSTPLGMTRVINKKEAPVWRPPESIRKEHEELGDPLPLVVEAGPENPLGTHALYLGIPGYLIHGTNKEKGWGVGRRVSHGCIRLYPNDIATLFPEVPVNAKVNIVDQPYKAGWRDGQFYLEVQPPLINLDEEPEFVDGKMVESHLDQNINLTRVMRVIMDVLGKDNPRLDWTAVLRVAQEQTGVPTVVSLSKAIEPNGPGIPD